MKWLKKSNYSSELKSNRFSVRWWNSAQQSTKLQSGRKWVKWEHIFAFSHFSLLCWSGMHSLILERWRWRLRIWFYSSHTEAKTHFNPFYHHIYTLLLQLSTLKVSPVSKEYSTLTKLIYPERQDGFSLRSFCSLKGESLQKGFYWLNFYWVECTNVESCLKHSDYICNISDDSTRYIVSLHRKPRHQGIIIILMSQFVDIFLIASL